MKVNRENNLSILSVRVSHNPTTDSTIGLACLTRWEDGALTVKDTHVFDFPSEDMREVSVAVSEIERFKDSIEDSAFNPSLAPRISRIVVEIAPTDTEYFFNRNCFMSKIVKMASESSGNVVFVSPKVVHSRLTGGRYEADALQQNDRNIAAVVFATTGYRFQIDDDNYEFRGSPHRTLPDAETEDICLLHSCAVGTAYYGMTI